MRPDAHRTDDCTVDAFLGGKLMLSQPRHGHRAGHDAMLLAASVGASPGQNVVDLGAGVGAAGLAVAHRIRGIDLALVEIDPKLAALAAANADANGLPATIAEADVTDVATLDAAGIHANSAHGVLMNPPFHGASRHRGSPQEARRVAHIASEHTLEDWLAAARRLLRPRGILTMIWRADGLPEILRTLTAGFGSIAVQPVYAARSKPALRVLVRAIKDGRGPLHLNTPAWLDGSDDEVEAAIRGEGNLPLARL